VLANAAAWEQGWKAPASGPAPWDRVKVNGSSVAVGHPWAATGGRILTTLAYEDGSAAGATWPGQHLRGGRDGRRVPHHTKLTDSSLRTAGGLRSQDLSNCRNVGIESAANPI